MAETLRDLVVSLSLDSGNFSSNLKSINAQLKEADSQFKAAGAGVTNFENTTAGAEAKLSTLEQKLRLQQQAVTQYEQALEKAREKLQNSADAHDKLSAKLDTAKEKHSALGTQIEQTQQKLDALKAAGEENSTEYQQMSSELEQLQTEYEASGQEIEKLEQQLTRSEAAMQRNADGVTRANTNLNNARAAVSQTQAEIGTLTDRLNRMKDGWLQAADKMAAFGSKCTEVGKSVENVGKQMSKVSTAVAALGTASVKTFASYDDSIRQVYATMGLSESENADQMQALSEAAQEMGASTRYSASEAASALNYLALAGYNSDQAIEALPTVLGLAQAGGIDLASASDMVTDSMSALGLEMDEMSGFADQMAKTSQKSNTSVAQLGEGILKVSATAKNLKGGTVELNTALGILADNGIKGAEGGTHLRNVILSLQSPTSDAAKQLEAMGIQIYDAQGDMRGLDEIFGDMDTAMNGWTQSAKDAALSAIFNKTDLTAVNALLSNCGARWTELSGEISDCEGTASDMAETMEGGIGGAFRSLKSALEGLAISFGESLAPTIQSIAEKVTELVRKWTEMDEGTKQSIIRIGAIVAAVGPLLVVAGKVIQLTGKGITGISNVMKAVAKIPEKFTTLKTTISTFATNAVTSVKSFATAVSNAGGGFSGFISVVSSSPAAIALFAAAAAYGIYKLVDWASGAKAAREAQEKLNATVKEWSNDVTTAYESSKGMSAFGLTADDFAVESADSATDWLSTTIATWTDGKKETDEIVSDTVKGFTDGTDEIRTSLQTLKDSTGGTAVGDLDGDLETLDAIDAEVESILQKKQNGYLSDDETERLQELIDQRDAIRIKYQLVTDTDSAFQSITDGVESALSRGADKTSTWNDAFAAATQGLGAFTDSLNEQYDARYAVIQAMDDEAEKETALEELQTWYTDQANAATKQYAQTLIDSAQQTGVFAEGGQFDQTADKLRQINELMTAAAGKDSKSEEMTALRDALSGLDESSIVEMDSAIAAMEQAAADAGVEVPEDVQQARQALEEIKATATDTSNIFSDDVAESINTMFDGLSEEAHEVYATLNCDQLSTAYDAWAKGEHASIIPEITMPEDTDVTIDATMPVELTGIPDTIELSATAPVTLTGLPDSVTVAADAPVTLTGVPDTLTVDAESPVTLTGLPDGPITVPANSPTTLTGLPDNVTVECDSPVTLSGVPETMSVECDSPVTMTGVPEQLEVQCVSPVTLTGVPESIEIEGKVNFSNGEYTSSGNPEIEYTAAQQKTVENALGLNDFTATGFYQDLSKLAEAVTAYNDAVASGDTNSAEAWAESVSYLGSALGTDLGWDGGVGFETMAQYVANGMQLLSEGKLSPEEAEQYVKTIQDLQTVLSSNLGADSAASELTGTTLQDGLASALNNYDWATTGETVLDDITSGFSSAQSQMEAVGDDIGAGVGTGEANHDFSGDAETMVGNDEADMRTAADSHSPAARFNPLGEDIAAGVGQGMSQYDFSPDAATVVTAIEGAFGSLDFSVIGTTLSGSLATEISGADMSGCAGTIASNLKNGISGSIGSDTLSGVGTTAAQGLASGMTSYSFAAAGSSVGSSIVSSISGKISVMSSIGRNMMSGLASGIRSGRSSVVSAMVSAVREAIARAKAAAAIRSPSRVMRDEVGVMLMKGMGVGISQEARATAKTMANATKYTLDTARGYAGSSSTTNKTYNQQSTVNLSIDGVSIRSDSDIRNLAIEIAALTKRSHQLKGTT